MEQRSDEWHAIRKGKITASVAEKMVTPTGKPSTQAKPFIGQLIAEQMDLQEPTTIPLTDDVQTGIDQEEESRLWFQVETGLKVEEVGFIESNDGESGVSPDGIILVEDDFVNLPELSNLNSINVGYGIIPVELKNPKPSTHIGYILEDELPKTYKAQCHFALVITGAPYMYFMSYCPGLPAFLVKVERDDYTECVAKALDAFKETLIAAREKLT